MSHHCHHHDMTAAAVTGDLSLILTLFLTGLAGSFTHCIGMCGPIALSQLNARLIKSSPKETNEISKIKASLFMPYYLGKAITYCILTIISFTVKESLKDISLLRYIAILLLIVASLYFTFNALSFSKFVTKLPNIKLFNKLEKSILKKTNLLNNYGFSGLLMGMLLGLIPCGLVYASITTAITSTDNILLAVLGIFAFGMATIPGLFIVCYFGSSILVRYKKLFSIFFSAIMAINALLILHFIYKLL